MPRKQHTHKYILRQTGQQPVWACALDFCNHYMPPHLTALVEGRMSICWSCEMPFKLDIIGMKSPDGKPYCSDCRITNPGSNPIIKEIELPPFENVEKRICPICKVNPTMNDGQGKICLPCFMKN